MLPEGVRFIDSWIVDDDRLDVCYEVVEADHRALVDSWLARWTDLLEAEVMSVIKSPEAAARCGHSWDGSPRPSAPAPARSEARVLQGGCQCGAIRYAIRGEPFDETLCHCTVCRRSSGAPAVAWFSVRKDALEFTSGAPAAHASSEHGTRGFCARCGSQLTFSSSHHPDEIDVTAATLDDPERVPPKDHTFTSSSLSWARCEDGLPRFAEAK